MFSLITKDVDYTLRIEILITDYQLWHESRISIDKVKSKGLTIGDVFVKKFSHRYIDSSNSIEFMYYHNVIVNFRKTSPDPLYQLHLPIDIPQDGDNLQTSGQNFTGNYIVAYGIIGTESNIDSDKTCDFHTAFNIEPTKVKMNVPLDMNRQRIPNFNPYVINVWNCHFKTNTRGRSQISFSNGRHINTVAQYSNFTILKIRITTKDTFSSPRQYMLTFKNSNCLFNLNHNGFNQMDNTLNWGLDNNSLLNYVYLRKSESGMPEEISANVYVKLPLLQG